MKTVKEAAKKHFDTITLPGINTGGRVFVNVKKEAYEDAFLEAFISGAEFVRRWISVDEELPEQTIETLFIEDPCIGGFYVTMNVNLIKASRLKCKLTGFESVLLYDICSYWESNTRYNKAHAPLKASLREFATEYDVSATTIKDSLITLLKWNLIKRENNGKEKSKYSYYPNVRVLKGNLIEYTELSRKPPKDVERERRQNNTGGAGILYRNNREE
jgi:hypothetical protein